MCSSSPSPIGTGTSSTGADALLDAQRTGRISPVPVKTVAQQELLALHRVRAQWMATRTARINALRGLLQEHGVILPRGEGTAVAVANKLARIVWAVWHHDVDFVTEPAVLKAA